MPLQNPAISVILPFCNAENSLQEALYSILDEPFPDFELLLVDNGSDDESTRMAWQTADADPRINLLHEPRPGIVHALGRGLAIARAPFIACMDADDIAYPERLASQYHFFQQHTQLGVLACQVDFDGPENAIGLRHYVEWRNRLLSHEQLPLNRFVDTPLVHPSVMFRKKLLQEHGGYQQGGFPEDFELWLRWMEAGVRFGKIARPSYAGKTTRTGLPGTASNTARKHFTRPKPFSQSPLPGSLAQRAQPFLPGASGLGRRPQESAAGSHAGKTGQQHQHLH